MKEMEGINTYVLYGSGRLRPYKTETENAIFPVPGHPTRWNCYSYHMTIRLARMERKWGIELVRNRRDPPAT